MTKTHRFVAAFMLFSALIVTGACDMQNSPYRHTGPAGPEAGDSNDSDNHGGGRQAASSSSTSTRESQSQSQASSGETNPGETQAGPTGTTDTGANTGIGAFSG